MHIVFLLEDQSSEKAMKNLIPKLLDDGVTYDTRSYLGIGDLPKHMTKDTDVKRQMLLNDLPRKLKGYGRTPGYDAIIVICDLDKRDKVEFLNELNGILDECNPKPNTLFCLSVEEFEAWYLGDINAIQAAYPKANIRALRNYKNDEICGTWELLADAIYKGGRKALQAKGYPTIGIQKSIWAEEISLHMDVNINLSPSFNFMRNQLNNTLDALNKVH